MSTSDTLLAQSHALLERLQRLKGAKATHDEVRQLNVFRTDELTPRITRARAVVAGRAVLAEIEKPVPTRSPSTSLRAAAASLRAKFAAKPVRATLVAADAWPLVRRELDPHLKAIEDDAMAVWTNHCAALMPTENPTALKLDAELKFRRENREIIDQYAQAYRRLEALKGVLPQSSDIARTVEEQSRAAHDLLQSLKRDVPQAVQAFLAQSERGRVSLGDVTLEVLKWLIDNDRTGEFEVARRRA